MEIAGRVWGGKGYKAGGEGDCIREREGCALKEKIVPVD